MQRVAGGVAELKRLVLSACITAALLAGATVVPAQAAQPAPSDPTNRAVDRSADEPVPDQYIVTLRDDRTSPASVGRQYGAEVQQVYEHALDGFSARMSTAEADAMVDDPRVAAVEQDGVVHVSTDQPSPPAPWGLDRIDERDLPLDNTYSYNATAPSVHAYTLDTGIRTTHTDFGGRASIGFDAIGDGLNPTGDCHGHGTHVAGTVGGSTYGVAKDITLVAVRVLDCNGDGTWAQVIDGVDWVTANAVDPAVANMSLSGSASSAADTAIANSIASGVTYAVAAGNNNGASACSFSPARAPNALTVAATDMNDARASYSNVGSCVDLFAPGSGIVSASNADDSSSTSKSGTSMASPHVTGTAALYLSQNPTAAPSAVAAAIKGTATTNHVSNAGAGSPNLLDFMRCVEIAPTAPAAPVAVSASAGDAMAVVVWGPPAGGDCSPSVTGYTVTSLPDGKTCTGSPAVLTCAVSELTNDTPYTFTVTATNDAGTGLASDPSAPVTPTAAAGTFTSVTPARILDTRDGTGLSGVFAPNQIRDLTVTGAGGVPSSGVDAVAMNVTVTQPSAAGFLTLFPTGQIFPLASNLNFAVGQTVPNLVVVKVGHGGASDGKVSIANTALPGGAQPPAGTVHVVADVVGWSSDGSTSPGTRFTGLTPTRILDTRDDVGIADAFAANEAKDLVVTEVGGVPANADAVVMNMTVTQPSAAGHLTVYPSGHPLPLASNLNFTTGLTVANLVVVKVGTDGNVGIANTALPTGPPPPAGTVEVIADVVGYYDDAPDSSLTAIPPRRILDTRNPPGTPVGPNATITVDPSVGTGLPPVGFYSAVVVNVTATAPTQAGYLTVFPSDASLPLASNLNFTAGKTVPNLVEVKVGADGKFNIANTRLPTDPQPGSGTIHVIVDIVGYYT